MARPVEPATTAPGQAHREVGAGGARDAHLGGIRQPAGAELDPARQVGVEGVALEVLRMLVREHQHARAAGQDGAELGRVQQALDGAVEHQVGGGEARRSRPGCRRAPATSRSSGSAPGAGSRASARRRRPPARRAAARRGGPSRPAAGGSRTRSARPPPRRRAGRSGRGDRRTAAASGTRSRRVRPRRGGRAAARSRRRAPPRSAGGRRRARSRPARARDLVRDRPRRTPAASRRRAAPTSTSVGRSIARQPVAQVVRRRGSRSRAAGAAAGDALHRRPLARQRLVRDARPGDRRAARRSAKSAGSWPASSGARRAARQASAVGAVEAERGAGREQRQRPEPAGVGERGVLGDLAAERQPDQVRPVSGPSVSASRATVSARPANVSGPASGAAAP